MDLINEKRRWWKLVFFLWPGQKPNYPFWEPSKKKIFFFFWIFFGRLGGYLQIFRKKVSLWFFEIKPFTDFWNWTHTLSEHRKKCNITPPYCTVYITYMLFYRNLQSNFDVLIRCFEEFYSCKIGVEKSIESSNIAAPSRTPHFTV